MNLPNFEDDDAEDPMTKSGSEYHVPNLERGLNILSLLSKYPLGLTQRDIMEDLKISKNSVYRIVMTLINFGYVTRDEHTRKYFLTRKMMMVGSCAMGDHSLVNKCIEEMYRLRDKVKSSVFIGVIEGTKGVILEQVIGGSPYKFTVDLGSRFELHCGAPGKALLAFLPEKEQAELLNSIHYVRYNDRTICTVAAMKAEIALIKAQGYAIDLAEQYDGCHCVGSCVFNHEGYPIAMIWTSGPSIIFTRERFAEIGQEVKASTERISKNFGYLAE